MEQTVRRADAAFDVIAALLLALHLFLAFRATAATDFWLHAVLVCLGLVLTRTSLAAVGHYHCHRAKDGVTDWSDALFDMQYVGASSVMFDGHVLMHHMNTQSSADVKRTVFTAMLGLPRLWRLPVVSAMRLGQLLSGHIIRYVVFSREPEPHASAWPLLKHASYISVRILLIAELMYAVRCKRVLLWCAQFLLTVWLNSFMIVASHEMESADGLSLSSHRAHHVLSYQRSGIANIVSERVLQKACEERGLRWERTLNSQRERLPVLIRQYLFSPVRGRKQRSLLREACDYRTYVDAVQIVASGFLGEGSI
eukprot:IDg8844t1